MRDGSYIYLIYFCIFIMFQPLPDTAPAHARNAPAHAHTRHEAAHAHPVAQATHTCDRWAARESKETDGGCD